MLRGGIHRVALTLGSSIYIKCSKESVAKAKLDVAYEALMQTEYGFAELPGVLVPHAVTGIQVTQISRSEQSLWWLMSLTSRDIQLSFSSRMGYYFWRGGSSLSTIR